MLVLDPEVVANGDYHLAHLLTVSTATGSPELAVFAPFFSSASYQI